jgi:hypothetical protein
LEEDEGRSPADMIEGGDILIRLDVEGTHLETALVVFSDLADNGVEQPTGTTVGRVEVHQCGQWRKEHRFGKALVGEADRRIAGPDLEGKRRFTPPTPGLGLDLFEANPILTLTFTTGEDEGAGGHGRGRGE